MLESELPDVLEVQLRKQFLDGCLNVDLLLENFGCEIQNQGYQ